jgi:hypothetical protein
MDSLGRSGVRQSGAALHAASNQTSYATECGQLWLAKLILDGLLVGRYPDVNCGSFLHVSLRYAQGSYAWLHVYFA